jgi:hypothetical protein
MTLGQSLIGMLFLVNMQLAWWEAATLFALWGVQFAFSPVPPGPGMLGYIALHIHRWVTIAYLAWAAIEFGRLFLNFRHATAFVVFSEVWRTYIFPNRDAALK